MHLCLVYKMADSVSGDNEVEEKKVRKRTKKLYYSIRDQMEFYFSDANITKDRFLGELIRNTEDGYVDLSVFLGFKRIRALTNDVKDILKSLSSSKLLQISEDNTRLRRTTEIQINKNVDICTVYVEGFSLQADHDWIREVFEQFGKVVYVSLPRHKTGVVKGFAFVEFDTEENAEKANKYFNPGNEISEIRLKKSRESVMKEAEEEEPAKKRIRIDETLKTETKSTKIESDKKHRKKKKKNKEKNELDTLNLRVMTKKEWKRLRNKYLQLQRANMAAVKKSLGLVRYEERFSNANMVKCNERIETEEIKPVATKPPPEFVSGVIIRFETNEPVNDAKQYRSELNGISGIVYIDLKDGHSVGNVRCENAESVANVMTELEKKVTASFTVLKDEEEQEYWKQILFDRENKINKKNKQQTKIRGRDKIISKAVKLVQKNNTHIRFDD